MSDLIERLQSDATKGDTATWALCHEACTEILRLRAEVKSARLAALRDSLEALNYEAAHWNQLQHVRMASAWEGLRAAITVLIAQEESDAP